MKQILTEKVEENDQLNSKWMQSKDILKRVKAKKKVRFELPIWDDISDESPTDGWSSHEDEEHRGNEEAPDI